MANINAGHILCPFMNEYAVVRRDKRGKLYYFSSFGKVVAGLPMGQAWMEENWHEWQQVGIPDTGVSVKEIVRGAPPIVEVSSAPQKPLTKTAAPIVGLAPLTNESATKAAAEPEPERPKKTVKKPSMWDFLQDDK